MGKKLMPSSDQAFLTQRAKFKQCVILKFEFHCLSHPLHPIQCMAFWDPEMSQTLALLAIIKRKSAPVLCHRAKCPSLHMKQRPYRMPWSDPAGISALHRLTIATPSSRLCKMGLALVCLTPVSYQYELHLYKTYCVPVQFVLHHWNHQYNYSGAALPSVYKPLVVRQTSSVTKILEVSCNIKRDLLSSAIC